MLAFRLEITNPTGLHTRPGTQFVQLAKTFACEIQVTKGEKTANAKSLVKLLKIGISQGDAMELICDGPDEQQAMDGLRAFIAELRE
jgi:phosphocarrier protein HPr